MLFVYYLQILVKKIWLNYSFGHCFCQEMSNWFSSFFVSIWSLFF